MRRRYRDFPCISCLHTRLATPLLMSPTRAVRLLQLLSLCWRMVTNRIPLFTLTFSLPVLHSVGLDKCIMTLPPLWSHTKYFHCSKNPLALPIHPFLPSSSFHSFPSSLSCLMLLCDFNGSLCPKVVPYWCHVNLTAFNPLGFHWLYCLTCDHISCVSHSSNFSVDSLVASQKISRLWVPTAKAQCCTWYHQLIWFLVVLSPPGMLPSHRLHWINILSGTRILPYRFFTPKFGIYVNITSTSLKKILFVCFGCAGC